MSATSVRIMKALMKLPRAVSPQIKEAAKKTKWNIVRGDKVQILRGHPEAGKQGIVKKVIRAEDRVIVEGVNVSPRRVKGDPDRGIKGITVMTEKTIHYSKVNLVCPVTNKPTRVFRKIMEDGTKVRIAKKSGAIIPKPAILTMSRRTPTAPATLDCTLDEDVWETTFVHPALKYAAALKNETTTTDASA